MRSLPNDPRSAPGPFKRLRSWFGFAGQEGNQATTDQPGDMPIAKLSTTSLRTELRVIDREIAIAVAELDTLRASERDALDRRDKLALDVAWQEQEARQSRLRSLEAHRNAVYEALASRFQAESSRWQEQARAAVSRWRLQEQEVAQSLEQHAGLIGVLAGQLLQQRQQRAEERQKLCAGFEALRESAEPVILRQPDVDWSLTPLEVRDLAKQVEEAYRALQQADDRVPVVEADGQP